MLKKSHTSPRFAGACLAALAVVACKTSEGPTSHGEGRENVLAVGLATLPTSFQESQAASGLSYPTAMNFAPDGRLFICEQAGRLRIFKDGALLPTPFLTLPVDTDGERGLLGVAVDPDFADNRHLFVYYTTSISPRHNRVSRFTAQADNPDLVEDGSELPILDLDDLSAANHNGGAIHFGPDGKLYVATGENAINSNSQSMSNLLGKVLRINKDGSIPADNPFYGSASGINRAIWALGLRNPFSFAFQPGTGRMFINDVGWRDWEEINEGIAGANFGWPTTEGPTTDDSFRTPFHAYRNTRNPDGPREGCAIIGAAFYDPAQPAFPEEYEGDYFYGDYCDGWIKRIDAETRSVAEFATGITSLIDIKVAPDGSLYYLTFSEGLLMKVTYGGSQAPFISQHPRDAIVPVGSQATFRVSASGPALSYQWQGDGTDIPAATSASFAVVSPQFADSGTRYRCLVSNSHGADTSDEATLHVTLNKPPEAAILTPDSALLYRAGTRLSFSGSGTDPEDGTLDSSRFTWQIDFHHETHIHPMMPATRGSKGGTLEIPAEGESSAEVWLRIHLTVTDKEGLVHKVHRDVQPRKAGITLATSPPGLQVTLDGVPVTTPYVFQGVAGHRRAFGAASQNSGGKTWSFASWSDGGAATHTVATPDSGVTFTAVFQERIPNQAPVGSILAPSATLLYEGGQSLALSATGTDPEDGALPDSSFTWRVDFHHAGHLHPFLPDTRGARPANLTVPSTGEVSADVFYRIHLTVRDKDGLTHAVQRDVKPRVVSVTLASEPPGLRLRLDGATITTPYTFAGVTGIRRPIEALVGQDFSGRAWNFKSWSHGGEAVQVLVTPSASDTLVATYEVPITTGIRH